jgi:hypothetical protein
MKTYKVVVTSNSDRDIQPRIASLDHPAVSCVAGIDTNRVQVTLREGADAEAYERFMDADDDVQSYVEVVG